MIGTNFLDPVPAKPGSLPFLLASFGASSNVSPGTVRI